MSDTPLLSPQGRARRESILARSLRAIDARRRRRIVIRTWSLIIALTVIGLAAQLLNRTHRAPFSDEIAHAHTAPTPPTAPSRLAASDPAPSAARVESVSDDQLLALLAQTGDSYGLIIVGHHTELVRNDLAR